MLDATEDIRRIEQYLAGELTPEETEALRQRIQTDAAFAASVKSVILSKYAARTGAKQTIVADFEKRYEAQESLILQPFWKRRTVWMYASVASIVLFIAFGIWNSQQNPAVPSAQLFSQYYERPAPPGIRGEPNQDQWLGAVQEFKAQHWPEAIDHLERVLADSSFQFRPRAHFFLGICQMELKQAEAAIRQFQLVDSLSVFFPQAEWYTALAYLQSEDMEEAEKILVKIAQEEDHYQHRKAEEVWEHCCKDQQ
ncbi:MAG: tetratricopeptide repeat protein [Bacteroidota bacterium]